mgnify:CR=1 FL=1
MPVWHAHRLNPAGSLTPACASIYTTPIVPYAMNYDRIPEDKTLIKHQDEGFKDKGLIYALFCFLKFVATVASYVIPRRHKPYGYACVNFGKPISLRQWQLDHQLDIHSLDKIEKRKFIARLGEDIATTIQQLIPVLPTSILAVALIESDNQPLTKLELKSRSTQIIGMLKNLGAYIAIPENDGNYAISQGIYILLRRNIIRPT